MRPRKNAKDILKEMNYGFDRMMIRSLLAIILILLATYVIKKYLG